MRNISCVVVVALVLAIGASVRADELINSDFETSSAGWTLGGPDNLAINDFNALADSTTSSSLWSYNTTHLPLYMSLDMDYAVDDATATDPFVIGLHVWGSPDNPTALPSGPLEDHYGYFLTITGSSPTEQVLQLERRDGPTATDLAVIGSATLPIDGTAIHHLRWTDCGCGRLTIYVDDMDTIALFADESRTGSMRYIGMTGTFLGVGTPGVAAGWIDNVIVEGDPVPVPEPVTMVLALVGVVGLVRRR